MQDINNYMRLTDNKQLQHVTLKLDQHHVVQVFETENDKIKAIIQEIAWCW